jgi:hypothetical protein
MYRTLYTREGINSEIILEDEPDQEILYWQD